MLTLTGPSARTIAQRLSRADLSGTAFGYMTARRIDLGHAPVLALRAGYVGELGWEFHVPAEYLRDLYDRLLRGRRRRRAARCRLPGGQLAAAGEAVPGLGAPTSRSDDDPYAAGLGFAVRPDKPGLLAGPALRKIRDDGPAGRLCWFSADAEVVMHGGELLTHPDHELRGAACAAPGYGYTVGRTIFSAYLPAEVASATAPGVADGADAPGSPGAARPSGPPAGRFVVEVAGERFAAVRHAAPLYDPSGARIRA